jgi:hypothetical protein
MQYHQGGETYLSHVTCPALGDSAEEFFPGESRDLQSRLAKKHVKRLAVVAKLILRNSWRSTATTTRTQVLRRVTSSRPLSHRILPLPFVPTGSTRPRILVLSQFEAGSSLYDVHATNAAEMTLVPSYADFG